LGGYETSEGNARAELRPLRVAMRREELFAEARTMVEDLPRWTLERADEAALELVARRAGGLLGGQATVTIRVEGPEGIPSATLHVGSNSSGGLLANDKAVVLEFMTPFTRRVC
jgi:hypothetical protein